jgi:hypothetical protein
MAPGGPPAISQRNLKDLSVEQPLVAGGRFSIVCGETRLTFTGVDQQGQPLCWAWNLAGGAGQKSVVRATSPAGIDYRWQGTDYRLRILPGAGSCQQLDNGDIRLLADKSGRLVLLFGTTATRLTGKM